jgi:C1A family cysteine protease
MKRFVLLLAVLCLSACAQKETFIRRPSHLKHGLGHRKEFSYRGMRMDFIHVAKNLPTSFDWRLKGGVTPVKDQGQTGDCWAFSSTAAFESAILIKTKWSLSLSEQYLNDCNPYGYDGETGGDFPIINLQKNPGQPLEAKYPFLGHDAVCKKNVPLVGHLSNWAFIGGYEGANPSPAQIKTALIQYGPVVVDVAVDNAFQEYGSGILNSCDGDEINHMVLIVGYNDAGGYWIVKNSWGTSWGEKGFIRMKYGCDKVGESAAYVQY